jgi:hypothetical protein
VTKFVRRILVRTIKHCSVGDFALSKNSWSILAGRNKANCLDNTAEVSIILCTRSKAFMLENFPGMDKNHSELLPAAGSNIRIFLYGQNRC